MTINILVVEDSPVQRGVICAGLERDPRLRVVGIAGSGEQALEMLVLTRPDVIVLDGGLPGLSGPETLARILQVHPVPVILYSASPERWQSEAEAGGAVATVAKGEDGEASLTELRRMVLLMSQVKVIRQFPPRRLQLRSFRNLAIGSSSGGPQSVEHLLSKLGPDCGLSVMLVQHLPTGAVESFARWLSRVSGWDCRLTENLETPKEGVVYLVERGYHLRWSKDGLKVETGPSVDGHCPSVSALFRSLARGPASHTIGVILSGMGSDGALGLLELRQAGGLALVEDPTTAAVTGMPSAALALGAAHEALPIRLLADRVQTLLKADS